MSEHKNEYPPCCDKRIIDWVRSVDAIRCRVRGCKCYARDTDAGELCLYHYMDIDNCCVEGCHRPALDPSKTKNYVPIRKCHHHYYSQDKIEESYELQRDMLYGRASNFDVDCGII